MDVRVTYDGSADAAYIYLVMVGPGDVATTVVGEDEAGSVNLDFNRGAAARDRSASREQMATTQGHRRGGENRLAGTIAWASIRECPLTRGKLFACPGPVKGLSR
jgi:hypothetical protein